MLKNILNWIIVSSQDPTEASATIKGILIQYVAILMALGSVIHLPFTQDMAYQVVTDVAAISGALLAIFGLGRKIYYEIIGKPDQSLD